MTLATIRTTDDVAKGSKVQMFAVPRFQETQIASKSYLDELSNAEKPNRKKIFCLS